MRERSNGGEGTTRRRLARGEREEEQGTTRRGEGGGRGGEEGGGRGEGGRKGEQGRRKRKGRGRRNRELQEEEREEEQGDITSLSSWGWVEETVILLVRETDVTPGNTAVIQMRFHLGGKAFLHKEFTHCDTTCNCL